MEKTIHDYTPSKQRKSVQRTSSHFQGSSSFLGVMDLAQIITKNNASSSIG